MVTYGPTETQLDWRGLFSRITNRGFIAIFTDEFHFIKGKIASLFKGQNLASPAAR
jgi:hypothetical protein